MKYVLLISLLFSSLLYSLELPLKFSQLTKTQKRAVIKNMKTMQFLEEYDFSKDERKELLILEAVLDDNETEKKYTEKELDNAYDRIDELQDKYQVASDKKYKEAVTQNIFNHTDDIEAIKEYIKIGGDVNAVNKDGYPLLRFAILSNNLASIDLLIKEGADVNFNDKREYSLLHYAIHDGDNIEIVKRLTDAGANINIADSDGKPLMFFAAKNARLNILKFLISKGSDINLRNKEGETLLIKAAYNSEMKTIQFLLDEGANVDAQSNDGSTALTNAVYKGHIEVVKLLIKSGADVNTKNNQDFTPLMRAAYMGSTDIAKLLLDNGANINAQENGYTAIDYSADKGHKEIMYLFRNYGVSRKQMIDKMIHALKQYKININLTKKLILAEQKLAALNRINQVLHSNKKQQDKEKTRGEIEIEKLKKSLKNSQGVFLKLSALYCVEPELKNNKICK